MGCGSSSAAGASKPLDKDPSDFHLDHLTFKKLGLATLDEYLEKVETPVNTVIDISNEINECINEIKDTVAIVVGALRVEIDVDNVTHHDTVHVTVSKADGAAPSKEEFNQLIEKGPVKAADEDLVKAVKALYGLKPSGLSIAADKLVGEGVDGVNKALGDLRAAMGASYKATVVVKTSVAHGGSSVMARLVRPQFDNPDSDVVSFVPATLFDVLRSGEAKSISAAEISLVETTGALSKAVKEAEAKGISATFAVKKRRVQVTLSGGEGDEAAEAKFEVRKALSAVNSQIFKLFKACANTQGEVNIVRALIVVVESLIKRIMKLAPGAAKDAVKNALKLDVKLSMSDEGELDFDFSFKVNMPSFEDKNWLDLLPGPAKLVYNTVMQVKEQIVTTFPQFKELAGQVEAIVKETPEKETIQEEVKTKVDGDVFQMPKLMGTAMANISAASNSPKTINVFIETVKRVYTELDLGVAEVKKILA